MTDVIAETEYGKVQGVKTDSVLNEPYIKFLGIPYAKAPLGELRFKNPQKPSPWDKVRPATTEKPSCLSIDSLTKTLVGSEDCLYLNIFTKNIHVEKPYPVLVYFHGGAYKGGSSKLDIYGPDYLLMADIVVVTFSYRVGPLGFLYLNDQNLNVPGNAGLKDQLMVLNFVKDNIRNFGGDPNNITAIGHSAGASSISWHCLSDISKNLFQKAVIMSGCALNTWSITPKRDWAVRLAKDLGYDGDDSEEGIILEFLQNANPVKMIEVQNKLIRPEEFGKIAFPFAPHIEPYVTTNTFISKHPIDLLKMAWSNEIDILIGGTSDEGLMYLEIIREMPKLLASLKLKNMVPVDVTELSDDDPIRLRFAEKLHQTYYSSSSRDSTKDELAFCKLQTDKAFWHGLQRIIQGRQNSSGKGKTFLYRFAVDSPTQNHYKMNRYGPDLRGVCHGDELSYMFKNKYGDVPERSTFEFKSIERFVSLITSFAVTGDANSNIINADMESVKWDAVDCTEPPFKCLNISESLTFEDLPETSSVGVIIHLL
ncbi:esterase B1-like [Chironomus tepperi]|uniref:esterase B1-like n=1 Tax=Chironomus tepperi TaxID=113505 RepID=UPI00391F98C4